MFHRITDIGELPGPTFFKLAWRMSAYAGVMQSRAQEAQDESRPASPAQEPFTYGTARQDEVNPGTRATLMAEPAFKGIFSFG